MCFFIEVQYPIRYLFSRDWGGIQSQPYVGSNLECGAGIAFQGKGGGVMKWEDL